MLERLSIKIMPKEEKVKEKQEVSFIRAVYKRNENKTDLMD